MEKFRLAVVGLQHSHIRRVFPYAQRTGAFDVVAVVEEEQSVREEAAQQYGLPTYTSLEELLENESVDAAALAPVNSQKASLARVCLEAGLDVIVDKPLATDLADLEALANIQKTSGRIVSLMLTLRFAPEYRTARRLIQEGAIGRLVHVWMNRPHKLNLPRRPAWMFDRAQYGGLIADLSIHDIDIFRWVSGARWEDVEQISALHGNYGVSGHQDFEDAGHVLLRLKDGTVASFEASWLTPEAAPYHGDCRAIFTGTDGVVEIDTVGKKVTLVTGSQPPEEVPLDEPGSVEDDFVLGRQQGAAAMTLPPEEAFESTAWSLRARDLADRAGRYVSDPQS